MTDALVATAGIAAVLSCGVMTGVLFAFSTFVMRGLGDLPPVAGLRAMQAINAAVNGSVFVVSFIATALICGAAVVVAVLRWTADGAWLLLVGAVIYLVGVFGVTATYHVPRNNTLALVDPTAADADNQWRGYAAPWTTWNHLRVIAGLAATTAFVLTLITS